MMTMKVVWVLVLIKAYGIYTFDFEALGAYDTMAECYVASTQIFWGDMPLNEEAVCMRVEEFVNEKN